MAAVVADAHDKKENPTKFAKRSQPISQTT